MSPERAIASAKKATQRAEVKLVGLIPSERVASVRQERLGSLLSCSSEADQWAGHARLQLAQSVNWAEVTDSLETAAERAGFDVDRDVAVDGYPRLTARTQSGVSILIGATGDGTEMRLSSFSACFPVPSDFVPELSY